MTNERLCLNALLSVRYHRFNTHMGITTTAEPFYMYLITQLRTHTMSLYMMYVKTDRS